MISLPGQSIPPICSTCFLLMLHPLLFHLIICCCLCLLSKTSIIRLPGMHTGSIDMEVNDGTSSFFHFFLACVSDLSEPSSGIIMVFFRVEGSGLCLRLIDANLTTDFFLPPTLTSHAVFLSSLRQASSVDVSLRNQVQIVVMRLCRVSPRIPPLPVPSVCSACLSVLIREIRDP